MSTAQLSEKRVHVKHSQGEKSGSVRAHFDCVAENRDAWRRKNQFFHDQLLRYYRFLIPEGSSILELGCGTGDLIGNLRASRAVGVDISPNMIEIAQKKFPQVTFRCDDIERFDINQKFDYIIISGTLATVTNIQHLLKRISRMASPSTRLIIDYHNELWAPILKWAEKKEWKMPEISFNWLSIEDIQNFLEITNYQVVRRSFLLLLPVFVPIVSSFFNRFLNKLPIVRRFCLFHSIVARLSLPPENTSELTCSVVLTCRDEEQNIEGLVTGIPKMGKHTEIIFVEGHSKDNTVAKIKEMQKKYPDKDIKLFKQSGIGQADAYRLGFEKAEGDLLCWLEADLTIPPEEIALFWDAFITGKGEYLNGSRFIYKMGKNAMPFFNNIGNRFFGNIFTLILEQRFTDTLCGFKAISKSNYQKICKQRNYFGDFDPFGDFELIFGAIKLTLKAVEIPVHYRPRTYGQPKAYGNSFFSFLKHGMILLKMSGIAFQKFKLI